MVNELFKRDFIFLDGAMGTMLQKCGMKMGENPMILNIDRPEVVENVYSAYAQAGSDIICANTFGASEKKLKGTGLTPEQVIDAAVSSARKSVGENVMVALDIGPVGELLEPLGTYTFDEAYEQFRRQMVAGEKAGVDLVAIETMADLNEVRAALLAVKENTKLPVIVTMTFEADGRTFTGCLPESFAAVCNGLGADAIGLNCSLGPREMMPIVERISKKTNLPVVLKPNAGMPDPVSGGYDMTAEEFAKLMAECIPAGIKIVGGCCGTTPEFIAALKKAFEGKKPVKHEISKMPAVCSASKYVEIGGVRIIGERINPTGKKRFKQALMEGDMDFILSQAIEQAEAGAHILDVNVGLPEIDERSMMGRVVKGLQSITDLPLQIDSSDPAALEAGLRAFGGKAIVNSVSGKDDVLSAVLPLVKKYGAAVVGLTLDKGGIPENAQQRFEIAERILNTALSYGIPKEDVYIDCLTLTVSAQQEGAAETLKAIRMVKERLGLKTVLGVSNISFGMPYRELINGSFLTLAMGSGLDLPIINPNVDTMTDAVAAYNLFNCEDMGGEKYIERFAARSKATAAAVSSDRANNCRDINYAIMKGLGLEAASLTKELLKVKSELSIIEEDLIPALDIVGEKYETGEIFLPQLLNASSAAGEAFEVVKKSIADRGGESVSKGTIVIATVHGDIHDIGKNIVKTILENYGYRMIDLGKDVPPEEVLRAVIDANVKLVGLSALMTTTLAGMEKTIRAIRSSGHECKIMVGGAVLTRDYAMQIGADYFAKDARESVEIAREVFGA